METPRFPSLFFHQRLNAAVLPMLGGISLFLLLPPFPAICVLTLVALVLLVLMFRTEGEKRKIFLCVLAGTSLALIVMGWRGISCMELEKTCHVSHTAEGYVVEKSEDGYDLSLCRLDGKPFYKRVRIKQDLRWNVGEKRRVKLVLYSPDPKNFRGEGVDLLASCRDGGTVTGKSYLYSVVGEVRRELQSCFSQRKNGGYLAAILLGDRSGLTQEQTSAFRKTASSHILAISGLHISQTVTFLICFLNLFPVSRRTTRFFLYPFIVMLFLLAGATVSVFRASVMTLFSVTALLLRRRSDSVTSLSFSAALLVISNPYALESYSFLLSYTATFGMVTCAVPLSEAVRERFSRKGMPHLLRQMRFFALSLVIASVSFVFTLPVQLLLFGTSSPFAPIYAVLLIPVFQISLIFVLLGVCAMALPFLPAFLERILLETSARFPELVEFLAKGAPAPTESGELSVILAAFFIAALAVMFWKRAPLTGILLLHGISILFFGAFSVLEKIFF